MSLALVLAIIVLVLRLELYRAMMAVLLINDESCFVLILLFYEADIVVFNIIYALLSFLPLMACSLGMNSFNYLRHEVFIFGHISHVRQRKKREERTTQTNSILANRGKIIPLHHSLPNDNDNDVITNNHHAFPPLQPQIRP
jgi:hypothetical protein